jgi:hypothetical protein
MAVIQSIHQVSKDEKGIEGQQSVLQYFNSLQCMTNFQLTKIGQLTSSSISGLTS